MEEQPQPPDSFWRMVVKFLKFCFLAVLSLYVAATVVVVMVLRYSLWHGHLLRFIYRTWLVFVAERVGSTSPGFVNSIIFAVVGIAFTFLGIWYFQGRAAMKKHVIETVAMGIVGLATVLLLVYGTQFAWEVVNAGYDDHLALVASTGKLLTRNKDLAGDVQKDTDTITELKNKKFPAVTACPKVAPQPVAVVSQKEAGQPPDCRISEIFGYPNPNVKDSMGTTTAVIHCNYRIDAPLCARVEFNQDFTNGSVFLNDEGSVSLGSSSQQGRVFQGCIQYPSLPANHILTVTVQGTTKNFPRATGARVFSQ